MVERPATRTPERRPAPGQGSPPAGHHDTLRHPDQPAAFSESDTSTPVSPATALIVPQCTAELPYANSLQIVYETSQIIKRNLQRSRVNGCGPGRAAGDDIPSNRLKDKVAWPSNRVNLRAALRQPGVK